MALDDSSTKAGEYTRTKSESEREIERWEGEKRKMKNKVEKQREFPLRHG